MYRRVNDYYIEKFGCKVYKLSIDGGFTCPNRDGTLGTGGCIFCSDQGGGEFAEDVGGSVVQQLERAKARVVAKQKLDGKYIAYFQAYTNTYAPVERLRQLYSEAMEHPEVVGLSIGTRPDCLEPEVVELLRELNQIKPISIELGLQTAHEATAKYIRRGYPTIVYDQAVSVLKEAGLDVVTHLILGLPGENTQMAVASTQHAVDAGTDGIKFHLLHVRRGTDLEQEYRRGTFRCLELSEYADILLECLRVLPPHIVVHRITGDGAKCDLIAPLWSGDKKRVLNYLNRRLAEL